MMIYSNHPTVNNRLFDAVSLNNKRSILLTQTGGGSGIHGFEFVPDAMNGRLDPVYTTGYI